MVYYYITDITRWVPGSAVHCPQIITDITRWVTLMSYSLPSDHYGYYSLSDPDELPTALRSSRILLAG